MVRRLVHALVLVLTLVVGAAAVAVVVSQTAWFKNWLRGYIVREAAQYLNGRLSIGRLGGNLFFGVELENVGVSMDGSEVVAVKDLGLDYNVFEIISRGLSVDSIRLNKPVIYLRREGDTWLISRLVKKQEQEANRQGPQRPIAIDAIGISDGSVVIDAPVGTSGIELPKRLDHLDAKLAFNYAPVHYTIDITHVSLRGSDPEIALNALSGGVSVRDDTVYVDKLALRTAETSLSIDGAVQNYLTKPVLNLQVGSDKVSLSEIARLVPALKGIRLQPAFELKLAGPLDRLAVDMNVRSSAGQITGTVVADALMPQQSVAGQLSVRHLDLAPFLKNPAQRSDITGDAKIDLRGASLSDVDSLHGTLSLNAPRVAAGGLVAEQVKAKATIDGRRVALDARASAYGASATAVGRVTLPETQHGTVAFDLRGQARHVDLRRLPRDFKLPSAATDVNAAYRVAGTATNVKGDARFAPSTVAGARIAEGSTASFELAGKDLSYHTDATVSDLDLQRVGEQFKLAPLATPRYKSAINGHVTASVRGTTPREMALTASGTLNDTTISGGRIPQLGFDVAMVRDVAQVRANGTFADFDPAVVSGKPQFKGTVGGALDVNATIAGVSGGVTVDNVAASGKVDLERSSIGGVEIERATVDGDYRDSAGTIRTLEVVGRDLNVTASGALALNETGQSNLTLRADSPSLDRIGTLVGRPLAGIAQIDATVTGNKTELQAAGHFTGNGIKYGESGALAASSDYTVTIPGLVLADANVTANTHATFVTIGGQNVNDLTAKTGYHQKQLDFDVTAKQPQRSLAVAGSLLMHPEHQEVHLERLGLQTAGMTWTLAPGSQPAVQYRNDSVAVENLQLVSGDQQIAADGAFGHPGDAMRVTLNNVDLAAVDALMLREPQLTGRLNASGTITGSKEAPQAKGDFQVAQGAFRQFRYESFGGTLNYGGKGVTLDAKLQQNPSTWLTAKGYLPMALFKGKPEGPVETVHDAALLPEDQIDFHINSSPIDVGLVQGFTTMLTAVTGTMQAHIDIAGSATDPHPTGELTIQNAAFTVEPTGVAYRNFDGRVEFQPDKVHIDQIRVIDNHQQALSVTGDLAVHERQIGGVTVAITAHDFKVIDNEMGNVRVDSNLRIAGELHAPRVEGDLGVTTGVINLDPIIAVTGSSAYATEQTEYLDRPSDSKGPAPQASVFDALAMDVHLTVPNDLVIKGNNLQTPGAPISLGAINVTLGGDLRARKQPGGTIALLGTVNTVRGTYDFQGRRFEILRDGTVRFDGDSLDALDPVLNIRTRRIIRAVEARVNIRGTLKQPEIMLSSTPPLEEADILSLIVFNEQLNQLGEGQQISLAARAQALAAGALAGQLAQSIGNALGLDTFEIEAAPSTGSTALLTIGEQVGQNLYVKVQQGIGDQSQTNFILEYELTEWLRLQTNVVQDSSTQQQLFQRAQGTGVDLLFFFSY
jgi:autotransporter translocation and assembly factor TamB